MTRRELRKVGRPLPRPRSSHLFTQGSGLQGIHAHPSRFVFLSVFLSICLCVALSREHRSQCGLKKIAHRESCELSFICGKMRTAVRETASQLALRNCSKKDMRSVSIYVILVKRDACGQARTLAKFCW